MADTATDFQTLLTRFNGLGKADRLAVLEHFDAEERLAFEAAVEDEDRRRAELEARQHVADRQFLGYSPWLAELVETSLKPEGSMLTAETTRALASEHSALIAAQGLPARTGWHYWIDKVRDFLTMPDGNKP